MGDDVEHFAAADGADMERGVGHAKTSVCRCTTPSLCALDQPCLKLSDRCHHISGQIDGVEPLRCQRRMRLPPAAGDAQGGLALVPGGDVEAGRLTHDAEHRPERRLRQHIDHRPNPDAADFLIVGQRQMQRGFQSGLLAPDPLRQRQHAGDKALHIRRTPAIGPAVLDRHHEGIAGPVLPFDRDNVSMAGEQHPGAVVGAKRGVEVGLGAVVVLDQLNPRPGGGQARRSRLDQRTVRR